MVGKDASKVMFISPAITGKPIFESKSKVSWQPEKALKPGTNYKVSIKPFGFKDVPSKVTPYQFAFNVIPLEYQIKTSGLSSNNKTKDEMQLRGQLLASDSVPDEAVSGIISAELQGKKLDVEWIHQENGKEHNFIIRGIKRDTFESILKLSWDGKKINVDNKGNKEISVPGIDTFKIIDINVLHQANNNPHVIVKETGQVNSR